MNRLTDVFGDSAIVAEDVRKTAYELEDKHNIASYPLLEAADHIESLYAEAVKMQAEIDALKADLDRSRQQNLIDLAERDALKAQRDALLAAQQWRDIESAPKDGTRILVYAADTHEIFSVSWMTAQEDGSQEWIAFRFDQIGAVAIHNATLWQPMPWPELARGDL